jgi:hypothetical protein
MVPLFLFYRNNQISASFPYTAKDLPAGETVPPEVMGKYYPCGNYVNPDYFNACCWDYDHNDSCCDKSSKKINDSLLPDIVKKTLGLVSF